MVVANLQPAKIMGVESQAMLLAAHSDDGKLALLVPDASMPPGSPVR